MRSAFDWKCSIVGGRGYEQMTLNTLRWLHQTTDRTGFACANVQYYLLRDNVSVCWPVAHGERFIAAAIELWDNW